jgi:hypothetical protein
VGLLLLQGLRSAEVLALNRDDVLLSEAQLRVRGKGNKFRLLPLAPETTQLLHHYLQLERPNPCTALFVSLKGRARGVRMTPAGLRSLFRHHRQATGTPLANPHRFRHTFASDMIRAGMSLPALMQLMGTLTSRPRCTMCRSLHKTSTCSMRARWCSTFAPSGDRLNRKLSPAGTSTIRAGRFCPENRFGGVSFAVMVPREWRAERLRFHGVRSQSVAYRN